MKKYIVNLNNGDEVTIECTGIAIQDNTTVFLMKVEGSDSDQAEPIAVVPHSSATLIEKIHALPNGPIGVV